MVSTVEKGDELEDKLHQYLLAQQARGDLVFGLYEPSLCRIHRKKGYPCKVRGGIVTFDVVIELYRQGSALPQLYVVFECKNYETAIPESEVNDFSEKLSRLFRHAAKGVIVVSSRLQSGAENVAKHYKMGIVKYDEHGLEIIADRKSGACAEDRFVEGQMLESNSPVKSMKFSAYYDGKFFGSIDQFIACLDSSQNAGRGLAGEGTRVSVPYVSVEAIKEAVRPLLAQVDYRGGPVNLRRICSLLSIDLHFTSEESQDVDGNLILGSANFDRKSILINAHDDPNRERFTIAHEVGHLCLKHDQYLRSEYIVERDLLIGQEIGSGFNYHRLEYQANLFASSLLLPEEIFLEKVAEYRDFLDIVDKGHGYIFVDDQPCNFNPYKMLLSSLSSDFEVSKQVIEIKLTALGMLTDRRRKWESASVSPIRSEPHI